jgi:Cu-Zn family superoxide dismutase
MARIAGNKDAPCLYGKVKFYPMGNAVLVAADICGLPETETGVFAMHIHDGESCAGDGFPDSGDHWNPCHRVHPRHAGDLPPLFSCNGRAFMTVLTDRFCLEDVLGKAVIIHGSPDDFHSQPGGAAGKKIACGIICK